MLPNVALFEFSSSVGVHAFATHEIVPSANVPQAVAPSRNCLAMQDVPSEPEIKLAQYLDIMNRWLTVIEVAPKRRQSTLGRRHLVQEEAQL